MRGPRFNFVDPEGRPIPARVTVTPTHRFFRLLMRLHVPDPVYYWFLDRLTDNNGWRPLFYRERRRT